MKKLMIAAAIVCAAAFAQAANFNWGFSSSLIEGPTDAYNFDGYLDGGYAALYIGDTLVATSGQTADFNFGIFDNSASDSTGKVQTLPNGDISESFVGQAYKLVLRTDDDKYEIVVTGTSDYTYVAGAPGQGNINYETFINDTDFAAGDWKAVPEPTSGLLLLLGVAGLALRRRRA